MYKGFKEHQKFAEKKACAIKIQAVFRRFSQVWNPTQYEPEI